MIAALLVERGGCYYGLDNVDPWDRERDARNYAGPHPVVAHPPCQLWVNFAALNYKRYGGEHNRPGNDDGCFAHALKCVREFGGVLEHPAFSNAWHEFDLQRPSAIGWRRSETHYNEFTCEVWQSAYGHPARKRTWLLYSPGHQGEFLLGLPPDLNWSREPGTHQVGWFDRIKPTLSKKAANATPLAFRDALINLASNARNDRRAA